ncbi:MAG: hypothetical protein A3I92_02780 [Candidatus Yanofskybacteria bacterium RIFCSPLOWO2_02_FULL_43_10b]|uniref:Fido domain-containing protein n=1 Tax=Candidatus Yanofskybacteria bacterium RIFCSPLOWO2_02_FULL_43_10b TaxID=1802704 RepID=A0A1F8GZS3_9BACT|nr:MAG: hypothetical protein A3I92_02780 [Candidatus Yanofskybacteria bacterium RIFCSPLOWO2_02_FULL_43_10b]
MIEEKESSIKYFDLKGLEELHAILAERFKEDGEPIPPFSMANEHNIDALIKLPQSNFFGAEQYASLESKAAIIFFTVNKKHIFPNANKRFSVLCLSVFLEANGKELSVSADELTKKALWLAQTTHAHNFDDVKQELEEWIRSNIKDLEK